MDPHCCQWEVEMRAEQTKYTRIQNPYQLHSQLQLTLPELMSTITNCFQENGMIVHLLFSKKSVVVWHLRDASSSNQTGWKYTSLLWTIRPTFFRKHVLKKFILHFFFNSASSNYSLLFIYYYHYYFGERGCLGHHLSSSYSFSCFRSCKCTFYSPGFFSPLYFVN